MVMLPNRRQAISNSTLDIREVKCCIVNQGKTSNYDVSVAHITLEHAFTKPIQNMRQCFAHIQPIKPLPFITKNSIQPFKTGCIVYLYGCNSVPMTWFHSPFRCIFRNEEFCTLIQIALKFLPNVSIDNNTALVKIMAWHRIGPSHYIEQMLT